MKNLVLSTVGFPWEALVLDSTSYAGVDQPCLPLCSFSSCFVDQLMNHFLVFQRLVEVLAVLVLTCSFVPLYIYLFTTYFESVFALTENTETSPVLSLRPAGLDSFHLSSLLMVRGRVLKIKK